MLAVLGIVTLSLKIMAFVRYIVT